MKLKNLLITIVVLAIGYFSYLISYPEKDTKLKKLIISQLNETKENELFDLTKCTSFKWDKLFMAYSDSGMRKSVIKKVIGINHYGIGNHINRFYFLNEGKLVKFFDSVHFEDSYLWMNGCNWVYHIAEVDFKNAKFEVNKRVQNGNSQVTITAKCKKNNNDE